MSTLEQIDREFVEVEPGVWQCNLSTDWGRLKIEVIFKGMCVSLAGNGSARTYPIEVIDGRISCDLALGTLDWAHQWLKLNERYSKWLAAKMLE